MNRLRAAALLGISLSFLTCASQRVPAPAAASGAAPARRDRGFGGGVFYEVFVRSFQDSNGDGKGDLPGLISRLDYLNDGNPDTHGDLGVDGLWLMPVFASPSYHGYDTTDYETVNPDYGTNADLVRLCAEAHRRGMRVIVDFVMNHTGSDHPWFKDSASGPAASKRDWYVWRPDNPGWTQPWGGNGPTWHALNGAFFYGVFWSGMPDLNYRTPAVRREMERIAASWLNQGIDGFRLDAARHMIEDGPGPLQTDTPETHAFWKEFAAYVRSVKADAILVGENWTETPTIATYYGSKSVPGGDELPASFDFPLADAIRAGAQSGDASGIAAKLEEVRALYPPGAIDAPFLTNHDQVRLATQLNRSSGAQRSAAAVLLTVPGTPFLYYGEEIGLENGPTSGDESKRTPMPWDATAGGGFTTGTPWFDFAPGKDRANVAAEFSDAGSLLARYRALIAARHASKALTAGDLRVLTPAGVSPVLAFVREAAGERVLVAHNLSDSFVAGEPYAVDGAAAEPLFADSGASASGGGGTWRVTLPPRATGIWRLR